MRGDRNAIRGLYVLISCANILLYKHGLCGSSAKNVLTYTVIHISILYANAYQFPNGL